MSTAGTPMDEGRGRHEEEPRRRETYEREGHYRVEDELDRESAQVIAGGSSMEVIAGAGAAVLGILGLVGLFPTMFVAIGCMAIGAGLLFAGGSVAAKYRDVLSSTGRARGSSNIAETGGGATVETLGGITGGVLGLLALIGIEPVVLVSIAVILLGAALMFGAGATRRLSTVMIEGSGAPIYKKQVATESVKGAAATQVFLGLGAAVLGVLALADIGPFWTLLLVAVIALGVGLLISGLAVGGKMLNTLYRTDDRDRSSYRGQERATYGGEEQGAH